MCVWGVWVHAYACTCKCALHCACVHVCTNVYVCVSTYMHGCVHVTSRVPTRIYSHMIAELTEPANVPRPLSRMRGGAWEQDNLQLGLHTHTYN